MMSGEITLHWRNYKLFPYERKFGIREVEALLSPGATEIVDNKLILSNIKNGERLDKLVYFSHAENGTETINTQQFCFEKQGRQYPVSKRQNTRYSVHGLHEYKGKFNPQVVRSLFNIFGIHSGDHILDPFCGSGTTLVEAAHVGVSGTGTDINPLAAFIANTKIKSLNIESQQINTEKALFFEAFQNQRLLIAIDRSNPRIQYLLSWFPENILLDIEALKQAAEIAISSKNIFLVIISNLLRDYSYQEPSDLRIRRRKTPFPDIPLLEALEVQINQYIDNLQSFQTEFGLITSTNHAVNQDIRLLDETQHDTFDFAITSPPYATALPYIDTQRLSLVWLELIPAIQIKQLESELIGSREFKLKLDLDDWKEKLMSNQSLLPEEIHTFCCSLQIALSPQDGFRKKAVPALLYRYFYDMHVAFSKVHHLLKQDKYFALIVGHNHTNIGGKRTEIDTPKLLSYIGTQIGFQVIEVTELDAYQRYGLNASNAVKAESLLVFKK